jgi:hypothetical protein
LSRQAGRNGTNNLTRLKFPAPRDQPVRSRTAVDSLHRTADAQDSSKGLVMGDKAAPESAHSASRSGQAGAPDRDPERRIDQGRSGYGAVNRVFDQHR